MAELFQGQGQGAALPLVTVAMPVYNAGRYLRTAVLSIVKQTFINWELLIIDDGSTDNALKKIADLSDSRIKILRDGENRGLAARLNEAIDLARGQYLARMDQDDVSYPERIARQVAALNEDTGLDLVAVRTITIDENNNATGLFPYVHSHDEICARPWQGFYFPHPTWMGKIEWFRKYHYTVPGPYFCEDQELLLRSYRDSKFVTLGEVLFAYRIRGNVDQQKLAKTRRTVLKVQSRHFFSLNLWHFVLLATVAFFGKISRDLLKRMGTGTFRPGHSTVGDTILVKWNKVLDGLLMESRMS